MTDEMLALSRENQKRAGVENAGILEGCEIENVPLPDDSVDVVISNCVINLSVDKDLVLREAFRVATRRRAAISDVVTGARWLQRFAAKVCCCGWAVSQVHSLKNIC